MKQTRQQKFVWVEIKQKDSGMQKFRKQTAAGIMKSRGRKEYVWQNEYLLSVKLDFPKLDFEITIILVNISIYMPFLCSYSAL